MIKKIVTLLLTALSLGLVTGCGSFGGGDEDSPEMKEYRNTVCFYFNEAATYANKCCELNKAAGQKIKDQNAAAEEKGDGDTNYAKIEVTSFPSIASMSTEEAKKAREYFLKSFGNLSMALLNEAKLLNVVNKKLQELQTTINNTSNPMEKMQLASQVATLTKIAAYLADDAKYGSSVMNFYVKYAAQNSIASDILDKAKSLATPAPKNIDK